MNWEIEYMEQEGVICIRTTGTLTDVRQNQRMISDGLAEGVKHGATRFLIDDRDLTLKVGTLDIYYMPEAFDNLGVSREYKVAIVLAVATEDVKAFKFYETRAANVGYRHRLFTDLNVALDWLADRDT